MDMIFDTITSSSSSDKVLITDEELTGGFLAERIGNVLTKLLLHLKTKTIEVDPTEKNLKTARDHLDRCCKLYNEKRK